MSYRPDDPNDPFNIFCSITERSNEHMTALYELTEADTRIIRQARNAISMLLDGAYRQLETIHQCPNGDMDDTYLSVTDELLAHIKEEVNSRLTSADIID